MNLHTHTHTHSSCIFSTMDCEQNDFKVTNLYCITTIFSVVFISKDFNLPLF